MPEFVGFPLTPFSVNGITIGLCMFLIIMGGKKNNKQTIHKHTHIHTYTHTYTHTNTHKHIPNTPGLFGVKNFAAGAVICGVFTFFTILYRAYYLRLRFGRAAHTLPLQLCPPTTKKDRLGLYHSFLFFHFLFIHSFLSFKSIKKIRET